VVGAISVALFFTDGHQPEMSPQEYLRHNLTSHTSLPWLVPLLYVLFVLTVVFAAGMRYSGPSRRGRALFLFTIGIALMVLASGFFIVRALSKTDFIGVGTTVGVLAFAMIIVATGALLPTVEDWFGARRELRAIDPLLDELGRRQPDVGIGVRPRGPLTFRVAERMSLISDALFLEASEAVESEIASPARAERSQHGGSVDEPPELVEDLDAPDVPPREQARAIANWVLETKDGRDGCAFPGLSWLRQPEDCSDREWILTIAQEYRRLDGAHHDAEQDAEDRYRD
jgi:hypothetical protein